MFWRLHKTVLTEAYDNCGLSCSASFCLVMPSGCWIKTCFTNSVPSLRRVCIFLLPIFSCPVRLALHLRQRPVKFWLLILFRHWGLAHFTFSFPHPLLRLKIGRTVQFRLSFNSYTFNSPPLLLLVV